MAKRISLSKRREQWAQQFKPQIIRGTPLNYNAALSTRIEADLLKLVRQMTRETQREVLALFRSDVGRQFFGMDASVSSQSRILLNALTNTFMKIFKSRAKSITEKMLSGAAATSRSSLSQSIEQLTGGVTLSTDFFSGPLKEKLSAAVTQSVNLIVSIPEKYLGSVKNAVTSSISSGNGLADLVPFFERQNGITERHASNMALDQTRKVYNTINAGRMRSAGIRKFEWLHSAGGHHPRPFHLHNLNGNIFDLDNPPVIDPKTGERGLPGQLPNCKCRMRPVIELDDGTTT
ncbi:phage head morphogenesis protein [Superficieibacter electus]|uniref:Phage head morphogenesis protein n=1 Tax=Superficieibacter electus TaxID=2022662 RepID=A0A2P5GVF1_9ENTR|nr:phage minor head protein [Superficieibacter electus]POP42335.1 phage head morphogenesis protein [Superficieibacter electus]POP50524.1 phage head morphogenesis protein [Superficieibacter electus]